MPHKTITFGPVAAGLIVGGIFGAGFLLGFGEHKRFADFRAERDDVFEQFVDILGHSDGVDEVWYE